LPLRDDETRMVLRAIVQKPGVHFRRIMVEADIQQPQLYSRLRILLESKFIRQKRIGYRLCFYPTERGRRAFIQDGISQSKAFREVAGAFPEYKQLLTAGGLILHGELSRHEGHPVQVPGVKTSEKTLMLMMRFIQVRLELLEREHVDTRGLRLDFERAKNLINAFEGDEERDPDKRWRKLAKLLGEVTELLLKAQSLCNQLP